MRYELYDGYRYEEKVLDMERNPVGDIDGVVLMYYYYYYFNG